MIQTMSDFVLQSMASTQCSFKYFEQCISSGLDLQEIVFWHHFIKVRKMAKIWNRYNQAPHLTQDNKYTVYFLLNSLT